MLASFAAIDHAADKLLKLVPVAPFCATLHCVCGRLPTCPVSFIHLAIPLLLDHSFTSPADGVAGSDMLSNWRPAANSYRPVMTPPSLSAFKSIRS
jgi:hypothetical protein